MYLIHSDEQVCLSRIPYTCVAVLLFLLCTGAMILKLQPKRRGFREAIFASEKEAERIREGMKEEGGTDVPDAKEEINSDQGYDVQRKLTDASLSWLYQTPENKLAAAFRTLIESGAVIMLAAVAIMRISNPEDSILGRILSGGWTKGINVFSLTANIMILLTGIVISAFLRWALKMIGQISDARGETLTRLAASAVNYVTILMVINYCLINWGMNPSALMNSAGLIGIAVGIGGRDLITDIIAGLFIIFEGSFQAGDILDVNGFQGVVEEIGIRTTILRGWDLTRKIINNRNMTNVVNLSAKNSFTIFSFSVPYTVSVDELKRIFDEEFKKYRSKYPELISLPYFSYAPQKISGMYECRIGSSRRSRSW